MLFDGNIRNTVYMSVIQITIIMIQTKIITEKRLRNRILSSDMTTALLHSLLISWNSRLEKVKWRCLLIIAFISRYTLYCIMSDYFWDNVYVSIWILVTYRTNVGTQFTRSFYRCVSVFCRGNIWKCCTFWDIWILYDLTRIVWPAISWQWSFVFLTCFKKQNLIDTKKILSKD